MLGHARLHRIQTAPARVCGAASFITSAVPQQQQQQRLRRLQQASSRVVKASAAAATTTPRRTRTHLHGRLFSPAFEEPIKGDDNNNNDEEEALDDVEAPGASKQPDRRPQRRGRRPAARRPRSRRCHCAVRSAEPPASSAVRPSSGSPATGLERPDSGEAGARESSDEDQSDEEIEASASVADGSEPAAGPAQQQQLVTDENAFVSHSTGASEQAERQLARKYTDPDEYSYCATAATQDFLDPFSFIRSLPPVPPASPQRVPVLPKKTRRTPRCTLVLDLDETLVHSSVDNFLHGADLTFPVTFELVEYKVHVKLRPGFHEFLQRVSQLFEVVLFTASIRDYADALLDILDPEKRFIRHRLFREHCVSVQGNYIKDLSILDRDMAATVIVDNSPQAFAYQLSNGIPISSWYTDSEDRELYKLLPFLEHIASQDTDVRTVISQKFRLHERVLAAPALQPLELW